jgi:hypothetical protein
MLYLPLVLLLSLAGCAPRAPAMAETGAALDTPEDTEDTEDTGDTRDTDDADDTGDTTPPDVTPDPSTCVPATPADIRDRKGDYYRCLDTTLVDGAGCGAEGYPLGFGARYADRSFEETWYDLTSAGQDFFLAVSPCLQERLAARVIAATTCDEVWDDGFATHAGCYVDSGFCDLPTEDLYVIGTMFDADVYTMDEFTGQLTDVALGCAGL